MVDQDNRPYPADIDPSFAIEGDNILDALQTDSAMFLEKQRELGTQMSSTLKERIVQMDRLKLVPQIPTIGFNPDDENERSITGFSVSDYKIDLEELVNELDGEIEEEEDDEDEFTVRNMPGFWVRHKDIDQPGIFLDSEGKLWIDNEFGESGLDIETFYFGDADGVPLEEYPVHFENALAAMRQASERGLGIAEERRKFDDEQRADAGVVRIEADNERYKGDLRQRAGTNAETTAFNIMVARIEKMRDLSLTQDSGISPLELENILYHVFSAQEVLQSSPAELEDMMGSTELSLVAGSLISGLDNEIGHQLHALAQEMFSGEGAGEGGYIIRRTFQIPYQSEPDGKSFLRALAWSQSRRNYDGQKQFSYPDFEYPKDDFQTPEGDRVSPDEIRDWLLSGPKSNTINYIYLKK